MCKEKRRRHAEAPHNRSECEGKCGIGARKSGKSSKLALDSIRVKLYQAEKGGMEKCGGSEVVWLIGKGTGKSVECL